MKFKRLENLINVVSIVCYAVFLVVYLSLLIIFQFGSKNYNQFYICVCCIYFVVIISITAMLVYSLKRIRQFSRMLKANRVFANEWLMIIHLSGFVLLGLSLIFGISINLALMNIDQADYDESQQRWNFIFEVINYFWTFSFASVYLTMIIIFLKQGLKVDDFQQQLIA